jgi:predicted secreted Zn-dependent protease
MSYLGSILIIIYSLTFSRVDNNIQSYKKADKYNVGDTIKWSPTYKLTAEDFKGTYSAQYMSNASKGHDTAGLSQLNILYEIKAVDRKLKIDAYAVFLKNKSFLKSTWSEVLKHEQAHFDIAQIYALKFAKIVNETDCPIKSTDCFFNVVDSAYKKIMAELESKQRDFDLAWIGELSRRQYYSWIQQELKGLMEGK